MNRRSTILGAETETASDNIVEHLFVLRVTALLNAYTVKYGLTDLLLMACEGNKDLLSLLQQDSHFINFLKITRSRNAFSGLKPKLIDRNWTFPEWKKTNKKKHKKQMPDSLRK